MPVWQAHAILYGLPDLMCALNRPQLTEVKTRGWPIFAVFAKGGSVRRRGCPRFAFQPGSPHFQRSTQHSLFPLSSHTATFPLAVKITVAHDSSKDEVKRAINRSLDDIFTGSFFTGSVGLPIKLDQERRSWNADTLTFSLIAKMGPLNMVSTPISGIVVVTDYDLTIDVDLGILERLLPAEKARQAVASRLKGLLK